MAPFFISISNPDPKPDPKCLFRFRIGSGSDQQYWIRILAYLTSSGRPTRLDRAQASPPLPSFLAHAQSASPPPKPL